MNSPVAKSTVTETTSAAAELPVTKAQPPVEFKLEHKSDSAPSNWSIREEGDHICFTSFVTGRSLNGTIADFNKMLRSQ